MSRPSSKKTELQKLQAQLVQFQRENEKFKRENQQLISASTSKKKAKADVQNDGLCTYIRHCVKHQAFKCFKFVTDKEGEIRLCDYVIKHLKVKDYSGTGPVAAVARDTFIRDYSDTILIYLNEFRNYVSANMKDRAFQYMSDRKSATLPSLKDMLDIVTRKLDLKDPVKMDLAIWYVDKFLPMYTGTSKQFGENIRYYETISEAKSNPADELPDITPDTEAFGYVVLESNYKKWKCLWQLEGQPGMEGKQTVIMKRRKTNFVEKAGKRYFFLSEHPDLVSIYTKSDSGQEKYGGWTDAGVNRYIGLRRFITKKVRNKAGCAAWEARLLEELRRRKGITGHGYEEQQKISGKKSTATAKSAAGITAKRLFDDDEDDADEIEFVPL